jgi:D-alanine-D-alanine ligase
MTARRRPTTAVVFDGRAEDADAPPDVAGVLEAVDAVEAALGALGHAAVRVPAGAGRVDWLQRLHDLAPDTVFNLCEGLEGEAKGEARAAAAMELLGLPLTGASGDLLGFARRKDRVNALLAARGIPVPVWSGIEGGSTRGWDLYPAIVKPAAEDASVGITRRSVARDRPELERAVALAAPHGRLLVQEFLPGRELNVAFVGEALLPVAEIVHGGTGGDAPVVCYRSKWAAGSAEDRAAVPRCPARLRAREREEAIAVATAAWRAVGGHGYGRIDLRADQDGRLHVLDVNPNPDLSPTAGLARMAAAAGWSYAELVARIVAGARA